MVNASDLTRSYGPHAVLAGVSVSLHAGQRVGLVGRNGSGKSTLARILAGLETPDAGKVARRRGARVEYLAQEPTFVGDPTAKEAVLRGLAEWQRALERHGEASEAIAAGRGELEMWLQEQARAAGEVERLGGWEIAHRAEAVLEHLGVPAMDQRVASMSGGERRRVALARVLVCRPDLAILDEPTNHLDADTVQWLEDHLANDLPGALLLVTHDRYLLDRVVSRTLELDGGHLYAYEGGWEAYLRAKADRMAHERRTEANRQNYLRRELEWLRRQPKARTGKQKARIQRIEQAGKGGVPRRDGGVELEVEGRRLGGTILELHDLRIDLAGRTLVDGLDLILTPGERIGVVGPNGAGKTSLLRAVAGELEPSGGGIVRGAQARVAYLAQSRASLDDAATVAENVAGMRKEVEVRGRTMHIRSYLERFLFEADRARQPVGSLSGGERARVALARLLLEPANVLLLDEPTNDLDVDTLGALEQMVVDFDGVVLVVTHDRHFLDRVATSILAFEGEGRVQRYAGSWTSYREAKARQRVGHEPSVAAREPRPRAQEERRSARSGPRRLTYAERIELDEVVERIGQAEREVARLEDELADPALYAERGGEVPDLLARLEDARAEAARLMERWEDLESRAEADPRGDG